MPLDVVSDCVLIQLSGHVNVNVFLFCEETNALLRLVHFGSHCLKSAPWVGITELQCSINTIRNGEKAMKPEQ